MPRHQNFDVARPVNDNVTHAGNFPAKHAKDHAGSKIPTEFRPAVYPQASSLPGSTPVIRDPHHKPGMAHGISGIISSTTTSPETRQRLVSGILDVCRHDGAHERGPIHAVTGHDSTAYNSGMVHLAGSPYTGHHHAKEHHAEHHKEHHAEHKEHKPKPKHHKK